jgi:hypothetical protein
MWRVFLCLYHPKALKQLKPLITGIYRSYNPINHSSQIAIKSITNDAILSHQFGTSKRLPQLTGVRHSPSVKDVATDSAGKYKDSVSAQCNIKSDGI